MIKVTGSITETVFYISTDKIDCVKSLESGCLIYMSHLFNGPASVFKVTESVDEVIKGIQKSQSGK